MFEASHAPAITRTHNDQGGENAQQKEPNGLIEVRLEGEAKARAGLVPDAIVVAGDHLKGVGARRQPGVVGDPAVSRIDPPLIEAIESIFEERTLRYQQAQPRIVKFPLLRARCN